MAIYIFDTETTGLKEPEVIEAAWLRVDPSPSQAKTADIVVQRYRPAKPVEFAAMAVHHILDEDLTECQPSSSFCLPADVACIIGHNIDFDWGVVGKPDIRRIDTDAISRILWPEMTSYKLTALLYALTPADKRPAFRERMRNAHNAGADVWANWKLLLHIFNKRKDLQNWDKLWAFSEECRVPRVMPFGRHKGVPFSDIPDRDLRFILGYDDLDDYLRLAIETALGKSGPK